jgi:hypothetical protein
MIDLERVGERDLRIVAVVSNSFLTDNRCVILVEA